jgi:cell division protein FtsI/penicillin-binding protein 2
MSGKRWLLKLKKQLIWRTSFLLVFFLIAFLFLGAKLIYWQLLQGQEFVTEIRCSPTISRQDIIPGGKPD